MISKDKPIYLIAFTNQDNPWKGVGRFHDDGATYRQRIELRRTLGCTKVIESAFSIVETVCRNVKRWRPGDQIERWVHR